MNTKAVVATKTRRSPLARKDKLSVKDRDPNFVYRIVNDIDDRIEEFTERGYEPVSTKVGDSRIDSPSPKGDQISVGNGTKAKVMRIRKDWYEEDQATKQRQLDELEESMNTTAKKGT